LDVRSTLIDTLRTRTVLSDVPVLLEEAEHENEQVRARAKQALGKLAEPSDVPAIIELLLKTETGSERDETEKVIVSVCSRISDPEKRADPVAAVLARAPDKQRCVLLPLIGRIGGKTALDAIHAALERDRTDFREAAVRGLCNWPDASVADELLGIVKGSDDRAHRVWALRAYVRVVSLPSSRSNEETLAMFKRSMELASRDEDKTLILSRVAVVRDVATLEWVVPYLERIAFGGRMPGGGRVGPSP
jgi:HEAT repeat protein